MLKLFCTHIGSSKKFLHSTLPEEPLTVLPDSSTAPVLETAKPSGKRKKLARWTLLCLRPRLNRVLRYSWWTLLLVPFLAFLLHWTVASSLPLSELNANCIGYLWWIAFLCHVNAVFRGSTLQFAYLQFLASYNLQPCYLGFFLYNQVLLLQNDDKNASLLGKKVRWYYHLSYNLFHWQFRVVVVVYIEVETSDFLLVWHQTLDYFGTWNWHMTISNVWRED